MSEDITAIVGFGVDLGESRPVAVFGPGANTPWYDPDVEGPFEYPVQLAGHAFVAYSREGGRHFLCVPGTVREVEMHAVGEFDGYLDQSKVQAFVEWCDQNEIEMDKPRWLFTCYSH